MLKNRIYYQIKPYLPWRVRYGAAPDLCPANVAGLQGCVAHQPRRRPTTQELARLAGRQEIRSGNHARRGRRPGDRQDPPIGGAGDEIGFRSLFNFVPEGEVSIPREIRAELVREGFEVGVHDLHHDGKLFRDRAEFARKAKRINSYLSEWGSSGFRSAFMHHNLDWVRDLEILYDASTFDTDPFEPQPDGVNTIFPFWVPGVAGRGYVELPYTLPQDSTLFLLLKESSPEIWKRKLDWIVECGGMALVNVHPDYLNFDESTKIESGPFRTRIIRSSWNTSRRSTRISTGMRCPATWRNSARFSDPRDGWHPAGGCACSPTRFMRVTTA